MLPFTTPAGFPDFPAVTPAAMREALPRLLDEAEARVAALEAASEPTWDGRVRALTEATRPLTFAWHLVEHKLGVSILSELVMQDMPYNVRALPLDPPSSRHLGIAMAEHRSGERKIQRFVECAQRVIGELYA